MTSPAFLKSKTRLTTRQAVALLTGFVLMLLSGLVNGWSIFVEPIEQELMLLRQDTALVFSISLSVSIGGQMLAGLLGKKLGHRIVYWMAALFSLIGFAGAARAGTIGEIYLFYGIFTGLAIGMIYNLVLTGILEQFTTSIHLITGILLMGFGIGPLILGVAATATINLFGWRITFLALGFLYAGLLLLASFVVAGSAKTAPAPGAAPKAATGMAPGAMLKTRTFWLFFLWCIMLGASSLIVVGHSSLIVRDVGMDFTMATFATGIVAVVSGGSRVVFGLLADKKGYNILKTILTFCALAGGVLLLLGYLQNWVPLVLLGYIFAGLTNGGSAVYICAFIQGHYGPAHYGMNMAITNLYMMAGSLIGTALAGSIKTQTGSYWPAFAVMVLYALVGVLASRLLSKAKYNGSEEKKC